jgi:hypothetical protein
MSGIEPPVPAFAVSRTAIIPEARQDPVAVRASALSQPQLRRRTLLPQQLLRLLPEVNTADGMILKVDHTFLEKHRLTFNYSFTDGLSQQARFYDNPANPGLPDRDYSNRRASVQNVFTLSPQSINTASLEWSPTSRTTPSNSGCLPRSSA